MATPNQLLTDERREKALKKTQTQTPSLVVERLLATISNEVNFYSYSEVDT